MVQILPIVVVQWTEAALERGVEDTERERRGGGGLHFTTGPEEKRTSSH